MAGLAAISLQQRTGIDGKPFPGAKAYFIEAASLDPIDTYQDYGLGTPHSNPVVSDAYGVFPPIFIDEAVEFYRMRVTKADGTTLSDLVTLPVIGPSGGGGGSEVPVDANALFKTGYALWLPVAGALAGYIRMAGRTIGSATSGATERANADCEALYLSNWTTYSNTLCPVTGGRGASAAADWAANKPLQVLDLRNKGPFGLSDMGNSATSAFDGLTFTQGDATTAASFGGAARHTLTNSQVPATAVTVNITETPHSHGYSYSAGVQSGSAGGGNLLTAGTTGTTDAASTGITASGTVQGGGAAFDKMPPFVLGTWYQKL